jgi:hypothetical protein
MADEYRINSLKQKQTNLKFILEKTQLSNEERRIFSEMLASLEKEIEKIERIRPN